MLDFSFEGIEYGWLRMKIQVDHQFAIFSCDENYSDPLPNMIRMYNALKKREDAVCKVRGLSNGFIFRAVFCDESKETVRFFVEVDDEIWNERYSMAFYNRMYDEGKDDEYFIEELAGEAVFAVDELMRRFEVFFHLLTSSRLYPCHYPCWSMHDKTQDASRIFEEADKLAEKYPELDKNEIEQLELLYFAEHGILSEEGERFYKRFDNMMRTHKVPDKW